MCYYLSTASVTISEEFSCASNRSGLLLWLEFYRGKLSRKWWRVFYFRSACVWLNLPEPRSYYL